MTEEIKVLTRKESHLRIIDFFKNKKRGKVLDVPAGQGALSVQLKKLGFQVSACDIDTEAFKPKDIPFQYGNLNKPLPYADNSFNYVACVAGIHRIHNFQYAISEFWRILLPDGELVLSFPNYSNLEKRLKHFLTGSISNKVNLMAKGQQISQEGDGVFRQLLVFPQIFFSLENVKFRIERVLGDKVKVKSLLLLPLSLLIWVSEKILSKEEKEKYCSRYMSSFSMLHGGNNIIIFARKTQQ